MGRSNLAKYGFKQKNDIGGKKSWQLVDKSQHLTKISDQDS